MSRTFKVKDDAEKWLKENIYAMSKGHPDKLSPQFLLYEVDVLPQNRKKGVGFALVNSFIELATIHKLSRCGC